MLVDHLRGRRGRPAGCCSTAPPSAGAPFAVGGNPEAARLAGINVQRHTVLLYVLSGLCCGIAARHAHGAHDHRQLARTASSTSSTPSPRSIIGGTLLSGGRGTIVGTVLGVLIFTTLTNVFTLNNLATEAQAIAKGVIIVAAVLLQQPHHPGGRPSPDAGRRPRAAAGDRTPTPRTTDTPRFPDGTALPHGARATHSPKETDMSQSPTALGRRGFLVGAGALGAGAVLTALHQQHRDDADDGRDQPATSRPPAATTTRPARRSPSASPAPRPTTAGSAPSRPTPRPRPTKYSDVDLKVVGGHQRRQPADQPGRDLHQRQGRRHRAAAVRRRGADRRSRIKAMEAGIPVVNVDREFRQPVRRPHLDRSATTTAWASRRHATSAEQLEGQEHQQPGHRRDRRHRLAAADPGPQPRASPTRSRRAGYKVDNRVAAEFTVESGEEGDGEPAAGRAEDRRPLEPRRRPGRRRAGRDRQRRPRRVLHGRRRRLGERDGRRSRPTTRVLKATVIYPPTQAADGDQAGPADRAGQGHDRPGRGRGAQRRSPCPRAGRHQGQRRRSTCRPRSSPDRQSRATIRRQE